VLIKTAQSKFGGSSAYFNGSNSYLKITPDLNNQFNFGLSDFTIECWAYPISGFNGELFQIFNNGYRDSASTGGGFNVRIASGNMVFESVRTNSTTLVAQYDYTFTTNQWYHLSVSRNKNGIFFYINGVKCIPTNSSNFAYENLSNPNSKYISIGASGNSVGETYWNTVGYMDDFRIVRGKALYTESFTIPDSAFPDTITLPTIIDDTSKTWTNNNVSIASGLGISKYGENVAYFNGSSSYLETSISDFDFGTSDWTIEGQFYIAGNSSNNQDSYKEANIFSIAWDLTTGHATTNMLEVVVGGNTTNANTGTGGIRVAIVGSSDTTFYTATSASVSQGVWHHFAAVRNGTNLHIFLDGVKTTATIPAALNLNCSLYPNRALLGARTYPGYQRYFNGYMKDFNIIKGYAKYTAAFTPTALAEPRTVLALHADNFRDSNSDKVPATVNKVVIDKTIKKYGEGSLKFNGVDSYVMYNANSDFNFGTSDFTVQTWINIAGNSPTNANGNNFANVITFDNGSSIPFELCIGYLGGTNNGVWFYNGTTATLSSYSFNYNQWYHLAVTRKSGILKIWVDGKCIGSKYYSGNLGSSTVQFYLGGRPLRTSAQYYFNGYMDDFSINNGVALYEEDFTPPQSSINYELKPSLLFNGNALSELSGKTITNTGVATSFGRFGNGGLYFNGTSQYLTVSSGYADLNFGTGDFTISFWLYPNTITGYHGIMFKSAGHLAIYQNGSTLEVGHYGSYGITTAGPLTLNKWNHCVVQRSGSTVTAYVDGVAGSSPGTYSVAVDFSSAATYIGLNSGYSQYLNGYMDDFGVYKGTALYSSDFSVPNKEKYYTSLHLTGEDLTDQTGKTITNSGVTVNNINQKYGSGALYFNGSQYLSIPASTDFVFGTDDFCIEGWVKLTQLTASGNAANDQTIFGHNTASTPAMFFFLENGTGKPAFWDGTTQHTSFRLCKVNQYHHVVFSRRNGIVRIFVDGEQAYQGSCSVNFTQNLTVYVGGNSGTSTRYSYMYLDDLRVIKGSPVYNGEFTPPTKTFLNRNESLYGNYKHIVNSTDYLSNAQLALAPLALYKMSDLSSTGTSLTDSSGNGRHASIYGDVSQSSLLGMSGAYFGGNTGYAVSPSISVLGDLTDGYTIEFCACPDERNNNWMAFGGIGRQPSDNSNNDDVYIANSYNNVGYNNGIDFVRSIGATISNMTTANLIKNNEGWKHYIFTHDKNGRRRVYVNGKNVAYDSVTLPNVIATRDRIWIGKRNADANGAYNYQGYMSNFAVYNYALSKDQVVSNFEEFLKTFILAQASDNLNSYSSALYGSIYDGILSDLSNWSSNIDESTMNMFVDVSSDTTVSSDASYIFKVVTVILESISDAINASDVSDGIMVMLATGEENVYFNVSQADTNTGWNVQLVDQIAFNASINQKVTFDGITSDSLLLACNILLTSPAFASELVTTTDEGKVYLLIIKTIIENLLLGSSVTAEKAVLSTIYDNLSANSQLSANSFLQAIIKSKIIFASKGSQGGTVYTGYCVNKNIGATSLYENFKFNSYAKSNGKYYGASSDGIYELNMSDSDNGQSINAMFTTGLIDCGNSLKKRITDTFLAVRTDGEVFLRVLADGKEYTYKLSRDNNGMYEGSRVKIGRGLEAVNWQFEIINSEGSDFDIDSMKIYPLMLSRHGGGGSR
jgi:hypothetical protein